MNPEIKLYIREWNKAGKEYIGLLQKFYLKASPWWWTPAVRDAVKLQQFYLAFMACGTLGRSGGYWDSELNAFGWSP